MLPNNAAVCLKFYVTRGQFPYRLEVFKWSAHIGHSTAKTTLIKKLNPLTLTFKLLKVPLKRSRLKRDMRHNEVIVSRHCSSC